MSGLSDRAYIALLTLALFVLAVVACTVTKVNEQQDDRLGAVETAVAGR